MTPDKQSPPRTERAPRSISVEDYVKVIYTHTEWQSSPITVSILAARLGLSKSSVTEMVQKLDRLGLVVHAPYGAVTLTSQGARLALEMVRRHRLLETYLVDALGYSWDEVHAEAEVLEHVVSPLMLERIDSTLGHPRRDPHGDPIPDANGILQHPSALVLKDVTSGSDGLVSRISDADPGLLSALTAVGIQLDTPLRIGDTNPEDGAVAVTLSATGEQLRLSAQAAGSIWLTGVE